MMFRVKADRYDRRDLYYDFRKKIDVKKAVDLRPWCSPVEDQLQLGSCVGQAVVGAFELTVNRLHPDKFLDLSRLFVYYNARLYEGDYYLDKDLGSYVRNGIKAVNKWGVCDETLWPYEVDKFSWAPSIESYVDGKKRLIKSYYRIQGVSDMLYALTMDYPIVISMNVYNSFYDLEDSSNTILSMPRPNEDIIGGHAVALVGYDLEKRLLLARNSFGTNWADNGYFWMPFDYVKKDVMDNWIFDIELSS
jgi:C1A family cysteine protease